MLQPCLDRMVSKLATDCMAQRARKFFYKDWYAQNYSYCYDYIIQLSTAMSQHPYTKGRSVCLSILRSLFSLAFFVVRYCFLSCRLWVLRKLSGTSMTPKGDSSKNTNMFQWH